MQWPPLPDYGCFPRWPEEGQSFIHPDDVAIVTKLIPGQRVFCRESFDGTYYHFRYGKRRFRLKPCLWLPVRYEGFDVGDQVETVGTGMERELFVAEIAGMYFVSRKGCILYRLARHGKLVPRLYASRHLRLLTDKTELRETGEVHPPPRDASAKKEQRMKLRGE
jgi:hypothetical protein